MTYLTNPGKIVFFIILFSLILGGGFWYFSPNFEKKEVYEKRGLEASPSLKNSNWKEELNFYSSRLEIDENSVLPAGANQDANLTEYITQAFSQSVGPRLLEGRGEIQPEDFEIIQNYLPSQKDVLGPISEIKNSDLVISEKNDLASVKSYFNQIYSVYEDAFLKLPKDDVAIFFEALANKNFSGIEKIDDVLKAFDKSLGEVKKIPVPKGYENFAVRELNYLLKSRRVAEILRNAEKDPLAALLVASLRLSLLNEIREFHKSTSKELTGNGIIFSKGEGGYKFFE